VYNAWLNSPSHKENMVSPYYSEVGTAIVNGFGSSNAIVVVQMFGTQKSTTTDANNTNRQPQPHSQTQTQEPVQELFKFRNTSWKYIPNEQRPLLKRQTKSARFFIVRYHKTG
jgi:hypothetical protein